MERAAPAVVYDTDKLGPAFLREAMESFRYRSLISQLVRRNVLTRYKRSFLGIAWTMLNPLGTMIVMAVVFSTIFSRDVDYRVYLLSGLLAWNFFSQSSSFIIGTMIWGSSLLHQVYVPRTAFAISSVGTGLINLGLALVPLLLLMLVVGVPLSWAILFTPVSALLLLLFTLGLGLILSVGAMYFADIDEMFKVVLRAWMYLTPIIYPEDLLVSNGYAWLMKLNPMYYLVTVFRAPFRYGSLPDWDSLLPAAIIAVTVFLLGWWLFTRSADEFAYRV